MATKHSRLQPRAFGALVWLGLTALIATDVVAGEVQDWPGFRGPGTDGVVAGSLGDPGTPGDPGVLGDPGALGEPGALDLKVVWKVPIGSGYSGVAVAEGRAVTLYTEGESDVIAAFDIASGRQLWSYPFAPRHAGYEGSHDGPIATPLLADGRAFALSPGGRFFAVDAASGEMLWSRRLQQDDGIESPYYGFGASPTLVDGVLLLPLGGEGRAIAGFDPATGERKWSAVNDAVGYQAPVPMILGGRRQLVGAGETRLFGFDAASGEVYWQWPHGGRGGPGAHSMTPVPAGDGRIFLAHRDDASTVIAFDPARGDEVFEAVWEERSIRNSYNVPIYREGYLYAFSSRFLTCVDAATGESRWRSREPGDGFLIAAFDRLVIATKSGSVHLVDATPEGYRERAGLELFEDLAWSAPSYAAGGIFVRSFGELARLEVSARDRPASLRAAPPSASPSAFGRFLAAVEAAPAGDKPKVIDRFLAAQQSFPILEGERRVHFVYRGPVADVAVGGDPFGARLEQPMTRVAGTDLFYHSVELEPDARVNYLFLADFEEVLDPRNPRVLTTTMMKRDLEVSRSGETMEMSWLAMPRWRAPRHLEPAPEASRGRLEQREFHSEIRAEIRAEIRGEIRAGDGAAPEDSRVAFEVYLPHGYEGGDARFPVAYVHGGPAAREHGRLPNSLDHLIGHSVAPVIVVFVDLPTFDPHYGPIFLEEIVPFVDRTYRTLQAPEGRANLGADFAGVKALATTLEHPELFAAAGVQSPLMIYFESLIYPLIEQPDRARPLTLYLDWGAYDLRSPHENWDVAAANRRLAEKLRRRGMAFSGGEVHDGAGWPSWRNRTDRLFEALFPR